MNRQAADLPILEFAAAVEDSTRFTSLFQGGVSMQIAPGMTIGSFLGGLPGFTPEYVAGEVQTIFLDGTAIDDLETPIEGDSPVLALSAAMPGLAGAILRRNSFHAALRTATAVLHDQHPATGPQTISLKLFNSIARDRGPALLALGMCTDAGRLRDFFATHPDLLDDRYRYRWNGHPVDAADLPALLAHRHGSVRVRHSETTND